MQVYKVSRNCVFIIGMLPRAAAHQSHSYVRNERNATDKETVKVWLADEAGSGRIGAWSGPARPRQKPSDSTFGPSSPRARAFTPRALGFPARIAPARARISRERGLPARAGIRLARGRVRSEQQHESGLRLGWTSLRKGQ